MRVVILGAGISGHTAALHPEGGAGRSGPYVVVEKKSAAVRVPTTSIPANK
jgi:flavin-dependent dehydrogenase